jgi:hypothetical protein
MTGGTGTDGLNGGLGDDTYIFNAGDGATLDGTPTGVAETLVDDGGLTPCSSPPPSTRNTSSSETTSTAAS